MNSLKWDKRFLKMAEEYSTWSKDPSTKVGAVIINPDTRQVLSGGYNGFPRGIADTENRLNDRETKYKYVVHAEMNAIYNATYNGMSLRNSSLYVYGLPSCFDCAKGIIQVGVKEVICSYNSNKRETWEKWSEHWVNSKAIYKESGIHYRIYEEKDGIFRIIQNTRDVI